MNIKYNKSNLKCLILKKYEDIFEINKLISFIDSISLKYLTRLYNNSDEFLINFIKFEKNIIDNNININNDDFLYEDLTIKNNNEFSGLNSIDNNSFINTILQVLFNIPEFFKLIMNLNFDKIINNKLQLEANLLKEIQNIFINLACGNLKYYSSKTILILLNKLNDTNLNINNQIDMNEFYLSFIKLLEKFFHNLNNKKNYILNLTNIFKENEILKLFFGKKCIILNNIEEKEKDIYLNIKININKQNIYDLIEDSLKIELKDILKLEWFDKLPTILNIQLKRFHYNEENKLFEKNNDYFKIPELIDFSSFEFKNRELLEIKNSIINLKNKIKIINNYEESLKNELNYNKFFDEEYKFLTEKYKNNKKYNTIQEIVKNFENNKVKKLIKYKKKLEILELKNIEKQKKIKSNNFEIYSIIINKGRYLHNSNYYTFININKIWYKFDDIEVKVVTKEDVFKFSNGFSNHSAYSLFYRKENSSLKFKNYDYYINGSLKELSVKNNISNRTRIFSNFLFNNKDFVNNIEFSNYDKFRESLKINEIFFNCSIYKFLYMKESFDFENSKIYYLLSRSIYEYNIYESIIIKYKINLDKDEIIFNILNIKGWINFKTFIDNSVDLKYLLSDYIKIIEISIYFKYLLDLIEKMELAKCASIFKYLIFNSNFELYDENYGDYINNKIKNFFYINLLGILFKVYISFKEINIEYYWFDFKEYILICTNILNKIKNKAFNNIFFDLLNIINNELLIFNKISYYKSLLIDEDINIKLNIDIYEFKYIFEIEERDKIGKNLNQIIELIKLRNFNFNTDIKAFLSDIENIISKKLSNLAPNLINVTSEILKDSFKNKNNNLLKLLITLIGENHIIKYN